MVKTLSNSMLKGHTAAFITCAIWGTTFISTKVLLTDFSPIEILVFRFILGLAGLWILCPARFRVKNAKEEGLLALAGLTGVCLFYLTEYIALLYTSASNVSVLVSLAPFATAIFSRFFWKEERLRVRFFAGCLIALVGMCLLCFGGEDKLESNLLGDLLALTSAIFWALYAVLSRKIGTWEYDELQITKRIFSYGILFLLPVLLLDGFAGGWDRLFHPEVITNMLYWGLGASALCFVLWNKAVRLLGALKTSVYIYLMPVVTIIASVIFLQEKLTVYTLCGTGLALIGLFLSESKK